MDLPHLRTFLARRFSREERVGLYFTIGFLACAVLVVFFGMGRTPQPLDLAIGNSLAAIRTPSVTQLMKAVTFLGSPAFFTRR